MEFANLPPWNINEMTGLGSGQPQDAEKQSWVKISTGIGEFSNYLTLVKIGEEKRDFSPGLAIVLPSQHSLEKKGLVNMQMD